MPLIWADEDTSISTELIKSLQISFNGFLENNKHICITLALQSLPDNADDSSLYYATELYAARCYHQLRELGILQPNKKYDTFVLEYLEKNDPDWPKKEKEQTVPTNDADLDKNGNSAQHFQWFANHCLLIVGGTRIDVKTLYNIYVNFCVEQKAGYYNYIDFIQDMDDRFSKVTNLGVDYYLGVTARYNRL